MVSIAFAPEAQIIDSSVIPSKVSELIGFVTLVVLAGPSHLAPFLKWSVPGLTGAALAVALLTGGGSWVGGHLAEYL